MPNVSLATKFLEIAGSNQDGLALWCRGEVLTYRELRDRAAAIASAIRATGKFNAGDRVAILSDRTPTAYIAVVAALLAGGAYVPLNPRYPAERNRSILDSSGAAVIICGESHRDSISEITAELSSEPTLIFPEGGLVEEPQVNRISRFDPSGAPAGWRFSGGTAPDDLAYILFTSGSTGKPKGVPISHGNVLAYVKNVTALGDVRANDRIIQLADLTFDISVHDMFVTWLNGATLYSVPERATLMAGRFVEEHEITGWFSVPSTAGLMKQADLLEAASLPSLRFTLFCGEALTGSVAEAWCAAAPNSSLFNLYGPTEATVAFGSYRYSPGQVDPPAVVALGEAFPDQAMGLFTADGTRSAGSETGEICLSGSQVMAGYWNAPDLNAEKLFEAEGKVWYRTGDLGRYQPGTGYLFAGRVDHQVKLRGFRVELQEIEAAVRKASGRDVVAVVPWPATLDGGATGCVAFVSGQEEADGRILSTCAEMLPDYMVPNRIIFISEMPLNGSGKVDYVRLRQHPKLGEA